MRYQKTDILSGACLEEYVFDTHTDFGLPREKPAVIICPGGAYELVSDREAEPVALAYLAHGIQAFVLRYSVAPSAVYPQSLRELAASVLYVRSKAAEYQIDANAICVCGFSAGGHLAASLGTRWNKEPALRSLAASPSLYRPDGMILCYPVITSGRYTHAQSIRNLGMADSAEHMEIVSLEKQVDNDTVPAFLWHTAEDELVPAANSLLMAQALHEKKIPFELHVYQEGPHGMSLCSPQTAGEGMPAIPENSGWLSLSVQWIRRNFVSLIRP